MISTLTHNRPTPTVSVVIPCRNERSHIEACVRSVLAQQAVPGDFEVIVADGMSDDGTREILARLARDDARLRLIDNRARSTARGMNIGIQHARGEFIAIIGAHNHYARDYLAASLNSPVKSSLPTAARCFLTRLTVCQSAPRENC
jgi:glycosyltransferase involved in cell wall biosynthesis